MSESPQPSILRFDHVTVRFEGTDVLADVSFDACEGESRVILGAAGSGKTVLLKTSLGLIKPDAGGTLMIFNHAQFADENARDNHARGWSEFFDRLDRVLA